MKKGFTLIELLAVIVILSVLSLITIPIISGVIDQSKEKALESSAYGIVQAADYFRVKDKTTMVLSLSDENLKYNGKRLDGQLRFDEKNNVSFYYYDNGTCVIKAFEDLKPSLYKIPKVRCDFTFIDSDTSIVEGERFTFDKSVGNNLIDYQIYGKTIDSKLPSNYTEVNYIESSKGQYINTDVPANSEIRVNITFESSGNDMWLYGARTGYSNSDAYNVYLLSSKVWFQYGTPGDSTVITTNHSDGNKHVIETKKNKIYLDGKLISTNTYKSFSSSKNIYLFGLNENNALESRSFVGKVYGAKIWKGTTLLRNYVPCIRKVDNRPGMYDLVEHKFYASNSSSYFTGGSAKSPTPTTPAAYTSFGQSNKKITITTSNLNLLKNTDNVVANDASNNYIIQKQNTITSLDRTEEYVHVVTPLEGHDNNGISFNMQNLLFYSGETYTFSFDVKGTYTDGYPVTIKDFFSGHGNDWWSHGNIDVTSQIKKDDWTRLSITVKIEETNINNSRLLFSIGGKGIDLYVRHFQLEYGNNASSYAVRQENIVEIPLTTPLRCVGNVCDYIDYNIGKIVRKTRGTSLSDGTNWSDQYDSNKRFCYNVSGTSSKKAGKTNMLVNYFNVNDSSTHFDNHASGSTSSKCLYIYPSENVAKSLDEFSTWIVNKKASGTALKVYYELNTIKYETIDVPDIPTLKDTNLIVVSDGEMTSKISLKYAKER